MINKITIAIWITFIAIAIIFFNASPLLTEVFKQSYNALINALTV